MTTPTRGDIADHQFLIQEAIPDDVLQLEIGYLPSELGPSELQV